MGYALPGLPDAALLQQVLARCEALHAENAVLARMLGSVQHRTEQLLRAQAHRLRRQDDELARLRARLLCQTTALDWGLARSANPENPR